MAVPHDVSLQSEHVQRLLQCAVCLDRFRQPKLLPCQHTFCLNPCLEGLVDRRTRSIRCPECRADHFVPRHGPAAFPNNLTIISFLSLSEPPADREAEGSAGAVDSSGLEEAGGQMSEVRRTTSLSHSLQEAAAPEVSGCYVCHSEGRIVRCCHCDHLVCDDCHHSHLSQVRAELNRQISQIRRGLPQISEQIVAIGRKGTQFQNRCEIVKEEIGESVEKHVRELKARERTLKEDVDTFLMGELRALRTHQENSEVEIASMASFCDSAESFLSSNRPIPSGDLIEMKRQSEEHIETINCYEDGTIRPPPVKQIQASMESSFLSSTINNFGDLIITSGRTPQQAFPSRSRASMPPQIGTSYTGAAAAMLLRESRASSNSPSSVRRRQLSPPRQRGSQQVSFIGNETDEDVDDTSRWNALAQSMRSNRRSRHERLSDTRIIGRAPTLSQQLRDRSRHQSLGALPTATEFSEEDSPDRDLASSSSVTTRENRTQRSPPPDSMAATFPGARGSSLVSVPPAVQFEVPVGASEQGSTDLASTILSNSNSPSMFVNTPRNKYNQKGTAVITFGERGRESSQFTWPRGVAVSPLDDNIYISDSSNHRVQVYDNTGRHLKSFGTYGQADGEFDCLAGIAINGLGQVIIADRYNHRIQVFDRNGVFQSAFGSEGSGPGQLNYPWGVACDNMGFIYVCDKENHRIQVFQSNGTYVRMFGEFGNRSGQFENPHYIAVSPDNKVYVSDSSNHRIQVFSIYGDFLFCFGISGTLRGQMKFPRGMAIDYQGFVVVADSGNNRIQIFRADGRYYSMFGGWGSERGQFKGLEGVAILANGNVVVSDRENHRIQIF